MLTIHTNIEHAQVYCDIVALAWLSICGNGYTTFVRKVLRLI
jgi:hypothetical protein